MRAACFDLPAGYTCPQADICKAKVILSNGKKTIKQYGLFKCYATKAEVFYKNVYDQRSLNYKASNNSKFIQWITKELHDNRIDLLRIHSSGDFYDYSYFIKWYEIAQINTRVLFYGYTKQASFLNWYLDHSLPNLHLIYSMGGKMDDYARSYNLPYCQVIINGYNPDNLPIACVDSPSDDFEFIMRGESFGINLH